MFAHAPGAGPTWTVWYLLAAAAIPRLATSIWRRSVLPVLALGTGIGIIGIIVIIVIVILVLRLR